MIDEYVERCRCGHTRTQHFDKENTLEIEPLAMTEADDAGPEMPTDVPGEGPCLVEGCGCEEFVQGEEAD